MMEFWLRRIVMTAGFVLFSSSSAFTLLGVAAWTTSRTTAPSTRWMLKRTHEQPSCHAISSACRQTQARRRLPLLYAKPPPTSSFNLQAIEAYELQLDREAAVASAQVERWSGLDEADDHYADDVDDSDDDDVLIMDENDFLSLKVPPELDQQRLDAALSQLLIQEVVVAAAAADGGRDADLSLQCSRSQCSQWITQGCVSVVVKATMPDNNVEDAHNDPTQNTKMVVGRKSFRVEAGQELRIQKSLIRCILRRKNAAAPVPQPLPLDILYEDQHMIVLNKAADMVVHPAAGNWDGTVVNALLYYLQHDTPYGPSECFSGAVPNDNNSNAASSKTESVVSTPTTSSFLLQQQLEHRPGIVHRLDKGTTGVLVVGKTLAAVAALSQQFANRTVEKTYLAIAVGNPGNDVLIDEPIGRHPIHRQRMRVVPSNGSSNTVAARRARNARSLVDTLAFDGKLSWVQVRIETGRTHQIRVHLQHHHTPIYGDDVYGRRDWNQQLEQRDNITRPLLHAYQLKLQHPATGQAMVFRAPMALDMQRVAQKIDAHSPENLPDAFFGNSNNQQNNR